MPRWHGWKEKDEVARIVRWIETCLILPRGHGAGAPFKVADFQRKLLREIVDSLATFISIPAANGKTVLMAAVGLERLARGDDYVEVDLIATKDEQARRIIEACIKMIECSPMLHSEDGGKNLFEYWARDGTLEYRPTGSVMRSHPAKLSAVQGLEFSLALIDEIGFVAPEITSAMLARLAKEPDARVIGFGTPGMTHDSMLEDMRAKAHVGDLPPGFRFVEYAAAAGCDVFDREQWRKANPALDAGFMREKALALQAAAMPEHEFRMYHLGQPIEASSPWLPYEAWQECTQFDPPRDGTPVVLSVWGNYHRRVAVVGCTLDGGIFFGWEAEKATDDELERVLLAAVEQYDVQEIVHKAHVRLGLMGRLGDNGLPVQVWPVDGKLTDVETDSTSALYQAIIEGHLAHDHHPLLTEQVARLTAQIDRRGNPRLVESSDVDVAGALAIRAAWWRARALYESEADGEVHIY